MCGIFGCVLANGSAAPLIRTGLKKLEYRGYDSAGLATIHDGLVFVKKGKGKIDRLHEELNFDDLPGRVGIGHTRWATHGAPSDINAHPHLDCHGLVAVVHNGIIENFQELREELEARGHVFKSKTDTEVISHLVEEGLESGLPLKEAVRKALLRLSGSFAIAAVSPKEPGSVVVARHECPLVIGISPEGVFFSSDLPALLWVTRRVSFLNDGDLAVITAGGFHVEDLKTGLWLNRPVEEASWSPEQAEKGGFPHFMLKEIYEQPQALRNTLRTPRIYLERACRAINDSSKVFMVACGSSYYACVAGSYMLSRLAHIDARPVIASEFKESCGLLVDKDAAILALSQSGETADTLLALRAGLERGAKVLSVTNVMGSSITRLSHVYIGMQAGPEVGVAATKTYTCQLTVLAQLSIMLGSMRGSLSESEAKALWSSLNEVPHLVSKSLPSVDGVVKTIALRYAHSPSAYFLSRGINVATALEGALKLKEVSYIHAEGYPAGESKHGPISLVEEGFPCVFIVPRAEVRRHLIGNIMEMKARGASIIVVGDEDDEEASSLADDFIGAPAGLPEPLTPILYVVPLQLLAYHTAVARGNDPDRPRNLAKSVTVT
ncbi:MAG: glutamine--fructose-6-phosphate transaminase (isomerizing) [Candidatus Nezhaarchaeota archaeon]|nr:glutamine--fructose-6-phosphate transaminase (isomerizing) [Candidatus Nezhaarchaeota archaeon]